ncbi:ethanolamine utilization protein EutH [Oceanobacillus neutriphilus]|uniref:Ethanolamine utilization protein EutH n=1 Tax=Oceanobacillus neutriphilus TaxID=531815 RepID=A0ABQ2NZ40_9BACI|nr:ethanolamine utilization protein EutH [Oceanobacillus neutriphilus]GGP14086.1 ethanolamine utilization protein EutH [Oceanobacillus neutriphilus]
MAFISDFIIYVIMACAVIGAFAAIKNAETGLGREFMEGFYVIGQIFVPCAGIMASIPYLSQFISTVIGPFLNQFGIDSAIAATSMIAVDMGGYQLADVLAETRESWIIAMVIGYFLGPTLTFLIPVGLALVNKKDYKYMALGVMAGILTIPVGILVSCLFIAISKPEIREAVSTNATSLYPLLLSFSEILITMVPLIIFVLLLAIGLRLYPDKMIKGFLIYGKILDTGIKLVLVFSIVEHFTGFFSFVFGSWGFDPIIADSEDTFRALEVAGFIGIMLAGSFPFIYLFRNLFAKPLQKLAKALGMQEVGSMGLVASVANTLAMFRMVKDMPAKDKVINIAFSVCIATVFGDHLSFTANFQPNLILPIMLGKIVAAFLSIYLAFKLSVPKAVQLEKEDKLQTQKE